MSWLSGLLGNAGIGGNILGTGLGAGLGSIIPGVGTILGAGIGGSIGGIFQGQSDVNTAQGLMNQAEQERQAANAENIRRYNQALAEESGLGDTLRALNSQYSNQDVTDINRSYDTALNNSLAGLQARGLGNTTLAPNVQQGNARERAYSLNRASDARLARASAIESGVTDNRVRTITGRNDIAPTYGDIAALAAASGRNQAGVNTDLGSLLGQLKQTGLFGSSRSGMSDPTQGGWYSRNLPAWPTSYG